MKKWFLMLCFFLMPFTIQAAPPPGEEVFQLKIQGIESNTLTLHWQIKPGFYLYKDRINIKSDANKRLELGSISFPASQSKIDSLGQSHAIYKSPFSLPIPVKGIAAGKGTLIVSYQGCSENGFCYPPITQKIKLSINDQLNLSQASLKNQAITSPTNKNTASSNKIGQIFTAHHWPVIFVIFYGFGLLLSFTPCLLPMIPVLSGIIVGHGRNVTTKKAFFLSLSYVLSMSITYAVVGAIVALLGANIQVSMQSPWVISIFSLLFILLALSMFDFYEFKLPHSWQAKIAGSSRRQRGGHYLGAAVMGCLSTLILSPCVTAPLIGVLTYIAQTGNVILGSLTLFILSLGMGTPLLLIGTSAGKWLPQAGSWMNAVKAFFGVLLLAIAIYLLGRILPESIYMGLWAMLLIFSGIYAGALTPSFNNQEKLYQGIGIIVLIYGVLILIGLSMGGTNPLLPLSNLQATSVSKPKQAIKNLGSLKGIQTAIQRARGKPVMIDFYAKWCTACKDMEATTFKDPRVIKALSNFEIIKIDVTANNEDDKAILDYFKVYAPPSFLFFNAKGEALKDLTIVGEQAADSFLETLKQVSETRAD